MSTWRGLSLPRKLAVAAACLPALALLAAGFWLAPAVAAAAAMTLAAGMAVSETIRAAARRGR
jgi:hypothetical protein